MHLSRQRYVIAAFASIAVAFVLLAIVGGARAYSPVPFWDLWGYVGFVRQIADGHYVAWWNQHNEHRIVFARLLFWMDFKLFNGTLMSLIVANYLLSAVIFLTFLMILKSAFPQQEVKHLRTILACIVCIFTFSWVQSENFTWGFQVQYFSAQLFPLLSFYLIFRSHTAEKNGNVLYCAACLLGVASLGTMANGVLALPLMFVISMALRIPRAKVMVLGILAVLCVCVYFNGYGAPPTHSSLIDSLLNSPMDFFRFILLFMGGPAYSMTNNGSRLVTQIVGLSIIGSAAYFAYKAVREPEQNALQIVLIIFIVYVGGTAFGAAGGRLKMGLDAALSSRYMTPALMVWSVMLILYAMKFKNALIENRSWQLALGAVPLLLLPPQLEALRSHEAENFERSVAALALEMGIHDQKQIGKIFPFTEWLLEMVEEPVKRGYSIFGSPLIKDVATKMGKVIPFVAGDACTGSLDQATPVEGDPDYVQIQGWLFDQNSKMIPQSIWFLDGKGKQIGYALTGGSRSDVADAADKGADKSGFKGYLRADSRYKQIVMQGNSPACKLDVLPAPYILEKIEFGSGKPFVLSSAIVGSHDWTGSDFAHSSLNGYRVFGSYIRSDLDKGTIALFMKRGESIYYRSGPISGRQYVTIVGKENHFLNKLPLATDWIVLDFTNPELPETFKITLTDDGDRWGEWSAVGLKEIP